MNETLDFPFWGLKIGVDFDLRDFKNGEYEEINKIIFRNKNFDIHKTA